jgi:hypothetical protein
MNCPNCKAICWDDDNFCSNCNANLKQAAPKATPQPTKPQPAVSTPRYQAPQRPQAPRHAAQNDQLNPLIGVVAFCVPLVGLILYFVWKDEKPKSANIVGLVALASFGITMFLYVLAAAFSM